MADDDREVRLRTWAGFDLPDALEWSRVLRQHWPTWPGMAAVRQVTLDLERGRPAALPEWAEHARRAEAIGFTPSHYDRLHRVLDALPPFEHPAHPDNDPDPRWPGHTIRVFEPRVWSDWPWLVQAGWSDEEATTLLLAAARLRAAS